MPSKKRSPPPPAEHSIYVPLTKSPDGKELFSLQFVRKLTDDYAIDEVSPAELKAALEGWAGIYAGYRSGQDSKPRRRQIQSELQNIIDLVDELRSALENMPRITNQHFWQPENQIGPDPFSEKTVTFSKYGHTIFNVPIGPDERTIFLINKIRHFESLTILRNYGEAAISKLKPDVGGRPHSEALRMWAANVINYWNNFLKRQFTYDAHKGQPISDGARFCVQAIEPVAPEVSASELLTAIRNALKTSPKRQPARTLPE